MCVLLRLLIFQRTSLGWLFSVQLQTFVLTTVPSVRKAHMCSPSAVRTYLSHQLLLTIDFFSKTMLFSFEECHLKTNIKIKFFDAVFFFPLKIFPSLSIQGIASIKFAPLHWGVVFYSSVCNTICSSCHLCGTFGLFPVQCYYEYSCYKYWCTGFGVNRILTSLNF